MADIIKSYVDKTRLERYDGRIKTYISEEDANGKIVYFYKKENATLQDIADFSIDLSALISECYVPSFNEDALVFSIQNN